ncbi:hypothetical protein [Martelella soudanensis]|uniref:hypothetical protein n=1 Tax=unclassified Martelella TaxID=2629616 RepID=UPI0015DECDF3|nr:MULTISPECIES: hypothetical protein [unclassified Martelella]
MRTARLTQVFLAGSFLAASGAPAFALDTDDLMAKLKAVAEKQSNITFTYDSVEEGPDGDVTVSGVVFSPSSAQPEAFGPLEQKEPITLNFENVTENADGSYMIGKSTVSDVDFTADEAEIGIGRMTETNVHVPAEPDFKMMSGWGYGESSEIEDITVAVEGATVLTVALTKATQHFNAARTKADYLVNLTGITLDLASTDEMEPTTRAMLDKLDLLQTNSTVTINGNWDLETGDFDVASYSIATENVGTLDFSMELTGLTLETMETLQKISEIAQAEEMGDEDESEAADDTASEVSPYQEELMKLGQAIGVNGLSIRFNDDGITNRVVDALAEEKNISTDALITEWKGQMTAGLAGLEMPDLASAISSAVDSYFADPQSFTVSIKPQMQMPVLAVVMAGVAAPKAIPQLLNLEIKANQ